MVVEHDTEVATFADVEAIKTLKAQYFRFIDTKQWDALRSLLTDDMRVELTEEDAATAREYSGGVDPTGPDGFVRMASTVMNPATTVHQGFMPEITFTGPRTANGVWAMHDYIEFLSDGPERQGLHGYGHYEEAYRKGDDGRWRIANLSLTRIRVDPL